MSIFRGQLRRMHDFFLCVIWSLVPMIMVMSGGEWIAMDCEQLPIEWVLNCVIVLLPRKPELRIFSPKGY
jgi:hypothetical protein